MPKAIAVLGVGAIGGSIAADLIHAGISVTLIDQWPSHVDAMRANGLRVVLPNKEIHVPVHAFHLCEVAALKRRFDIVLLAVKSYDTRWSVEFIAPHLAPGGFIVSVQNSINDEVIAPIVGITRDVGCAIELSAELFTPGVVTRNTDHARTWFGLGELSGRITPRLQELETLMRNVGRVTLTSNIWGLKWTKLVNSSMMLGPLGMHGLNACEATSPGVMELLVRIGRESMAVGVALGYSAEPVFGMSPAEFLGSHDDVLKKNLETIVSFIGRNARGVVLQDFIKGRPTEAAYFNGLISRKGAEAGIPTPANDVVVSIIDRIDRGTLKPGLSNLELANEMLRQPL